MAIPTLGVKITQATRQQTSNFFCGVREDAKSLLCSTASSQLIKFDNSWPLNIFFCRHMNSTLLYHFIIGGSCIKRAGGTSSQI